MSLETTATYINSFNPVWPDGADQRSTADDHIRLIKGAVQRTFPNITNAITVSDTALNRTQYLGSLSYSIINAGLIDTTKFGYPQTLAEQAALVTPVNLYIKPYDINRYGTNTTPGTTDMTTALQAALNTGQAVYIPQGTYLITTACQLKTTQQLVYGDGALSILLTKTDIETLFSSTGVFGVVLQDIQFNNTYTGGGGGPTNFHVHFGTGASGCTVLRCNFNTSLTGAVVSNSFHAGLWFEGANLNNCLDCTFGQAQILMGSTDSTIRGGFIYSFSFEYAVKIVSAGECVIQAVRGILGGASQGCIWIPAASYMNKIIDNYFGGTTSTINIGKGVNATQQQMLQIINNTFHEMDGVGVDLVDSASGCAVIGNSFWAGHPKQNSILAGVAITGVAGQFSCTASTLTLNSPIMISGTFGGTGSITGYANPTTYYIIATNGTTTFTLSTSIGGSALTTTAGTPTGLTYTNGSIPGVQDILIESSGFGSSDVIITGNICNRFIGPVESPPMPGLGYANAIEIKTFAGVANNIINNNTVSGGRYYTPGIVDANVNDVVINNPGTPITYNWTPSDLSGAGLTFTSVSAKYTADVESVTFWCDLTFPVTANGNGVTIGGLPFTPAVSMNSAVGSVGTNNATAQKVKLVPGQTFFFLTNTVDVQQTNAVCSGSYFRFYGRYLKQ